MNGKQRIKCSRFLSKYLRHKPGAIGLTLEPGGWVDVEKLLRACSNHGLSITYAELQELVVTNDKQRFTLDQTSNKIRANQGHSIDVDLQLQSKEPPATLYHGTALQSITEIESSGLNKMSRHHVHLSDDVETARRVGSRHGTPVIYELACDEMVQDGIKFFRSDNGVWLVDHVPSKYLKRIH